MSRYKNIFTLIHTALTLHWWCKNSFSVSRIYESAHDKTYNKSCATSEDSDHPAHPRSLIRVLADRMFLLQPPGYLKRDKRESLPYVVDVQADLLVTQVLCALAHYLERSAACFKTPDTKLLGATSHYLYSLLGSSMSGIVNWLLTAEFCYITYLRKFIYNANHSFSDGKWPFQQLFQTCTLKPL